MSTSMQEHKTIRCFIALTIPKKIQECLAAIQGELKNRGAEARWVKLENIHITLRFLGDCDPKHIQKIAAQLSTILSHFQCFKLTIDTIQAFPNIAHPKIIWAGISNGCDEIVQLSDTLNQGLAELGIPKDRELFIPHFTLARCKTNNESRSCAKSIKKAPIFSIEAEPQSITLYQSTLSSAGSIYSSITSVLL